MEKIFCKIELRRSVFLIRISSVFIINLLLDVELLEVNILNGLNIKFFMYY